MRLRREPPTARKDVTRNEYAIRGAVIVLAAAIALTLMFLRSSGEIGGPAHLRAELRNAGGSLPKGADVKVRGVIVGQVSAIEAAPGRGVLVTLDIPHDRLEQIPSNVVARILPATVFGTSFVDLAVGGHPSPVPLAENTTIAADNTQGTLELQQALDDIDSLVKAVGPADLSAALGAAAQALDGRGATIGRSIDQANLLLSRLNPRMPLIRADLRALARNLELIEQVAPDLLRATDDALTTARTTVEQQRALAALLAGGSDLTDAADLLLDASSAELTRFIDNAARLLNVVYLNRRAGITEAILTNRMIYAKLRTTLQHGFINGSATILNPDVLPYYTADDCPRLGAAEGDNC